MKDWYLLTDATRPNIAGGYEAEQFECYKDDLFAELLESGVSQDLYICSSDLSSKHFVQGIVQGRLADTYLKSHQRSVLLPIGTIKGGNYIFYKNRYWLATGFPDDNGIYEKCTLALCQYEMKWQNEKGQLVSRWINATSASKYDMGENPYGNITTTTNNFTLLIPHDDETSSLYEKRVFLDVNTPPRKVFKITRDDGILYQYGEHGSILSFITAKDELNLDTDNQILGICNYFEPKIPIPNADYTYQIVGDNTLLFSMENYYTVEIRDVDGNVTSHPYEWQVVTDCRSIKYSISNGQLILTTNDYDAIGQNVVIELLVDGCIISSLSIEVISFL